MTINEKHKHIYNLKPTIQYISKLPENRDIGY